jgi:hypothetical protein
MVDVKKIQKLLGKHFVIDGKARVDPITGVVDVDGKVVLRSPIKVAELPVRFGQVGGNFDCSVNQLTTLKGSPNHVGGQFICSFNKLTALEGAPGHVVSDFLCGLNRVRLNSLDGAPGYVGGKFWVDYNESLPLLRLLQYNHIHVRNAPKVVTQILNKYAGTGKKGMLGAGVELARAGFKDNARW